MTAGSREPVSSDLHEQPRIPISLLLICWSVNLFRNSFSLSWFVWMRRGSVQKAGCWPNECRQAWEQTSWVVPHSVCIQCRYHCRGRERLTGCELWLGGQTNMSQWKCTATTSAQGHGKLTRRILWDCIFTGIWCTRTIWVFRGDFCRVQKLLDYCRIMFRKWFGTHFNKSEFI